MFQGAKCECEHGTCGAHCQRCCAGGPWAPNQACEDQDDRAECSCGERGACSYDDTGAILCVNCTVRIQKGLINIITSRLLSPKG